MKTATPPVAVIRTAAQRRLVIDASLAARAQGVRPGMTAAEARALCSGLECIEHDAPGDHRALDALGRWMIRFTPVVASSWRHAAAEPGFNPADEPPPACLWLDLTGCERLFGGTDRLIVLVRQSLARFNIPAHLAVASTPGAAWAMALAAAHATPSAQADAKGRPERSEGPRSRERRSTTPQSSPKKSSPAPDQPWLPNAPSPSQPASDPGSFAALRTTNSADEEISPLDALRPLPVESLRLNDAIVADLEHLGLHCVGDVLKLPRAQLPARFGPMLLRRIDQLTGALPEPLTRLVTEPPLAGRMEFDAPIESPADIGLVFEKLLGQVIADLARRGHGVRQIRLTLVPDRGWGLPTVRREVNLSRPHRDRSTLLNLLRCEIERIDCEHGFVRFRLDVPLHEPIADNQVDLFDQDAGENLMELERLLQRLRARLGEPAVIRPMPVESYLPERAWRPGNESDKKREPSGSAAGKRTAKDSAKGFKKSRNTGFQPVPAVEEHGLETRATNFSNHAITATLPSWTDSLRPVSATPLEMPKTPLRFDPPGEDPPQAPSPNRPLSLFPTPTEVRVICEPSDDRTGQPRQFTWQGRVHRLMQAVGPERIAGEWWRGHHRTRDYYDVEDDTGRRFWLFRVLHRRPGEPPGGVNPDDFDNLVARWFLHGRFE